MPAYLHKTFGFVEPLPDRIRYQLLPRSTSAFLTAIEFHAHIAVKLVQSFIPDSRWFEDFETFGVTIGTAEVKGAFSRVPSIEEPSLYVGWCCGDRRHRSTILDGAV